MIQFKRKYSMQNGNKVTKNNWHKVIAISSQPDKSHRGVDVIDFVKSQNCDYYEKWSLVYEKPSNNSDGKAGYIFREINHNGGINGRHDTFKKAIFAALSLPHISVFLED